MHTIAQKAYIMAFFAFDISLLIRVFLCHFPKSKSEYFCTSEDKNPLIMQIPALGDLEI